MVAWFVKALGNNAEHLRTADRILSDSINSPVNTVKSIYVAIPIAGDRLMAMIVTRENEEIEASED